jgi:LacI family transcriptional regulator
MLTTRPATLSDVAKMAGVSKMAVSAVISGKKSTVGVSASTRERILAAAEALHYRPSEFARSLRMNTISTIGLLHDAGYVHTANPFFTSVFNGLSQSSLSHNLDLLLYCGIDVHDSNMLLSRALSNKVDGLAILPTTENTSWVENLKDSRLPIVVIGERVDGFSSMTVDEARGSELLARFLMNKGHRHILYRRSAIERSTDDIRFGAFEKVVLSAGCKLTVARAYDIRDTITSLEEEVILHRDAADPITAVACWRDRSADRILSFCLSRQIQVPEEIAIVGFDGAGRHLHPSGRKITTIYADWAAVGRSAVEMIIKQYKSPTEPSAVEMLDVSLLIGDTA